MNEPKYKWNHKLMDYHELNTNPSAIYLLKQFPILIRPYYLSFNPIAIDLIQQHINEIYLDGLSTNPCAIKLLEKRPELIKWKWITKNPNAIHIIKKNLDKIDRYPDLGLNPNILDIIDFDKISWFQLIVNSSIQHQYQDNLYQLFYKNKVVKTFSISNKNILACICHCPNAIHIIEKNIQHIDWYGLSCNPNAIHILEKNIDKINWYNLCANPNAIHIIEQNLDKLDLYCWVNLSGNKNALHLICKYDYELMKENYRQMNQELIEYVMNPKRIHQMSMTYEIPFMELIELYG